jgi:Trk-type K+ transport system membrane component
LLACLLILITFWLLLLLITAEAAQVGDPRKKKVAANERKNERIVGASKHSLQFISSFRVIFLYIMYICVCERMKVNFLVNLSNSPPHLFFFTVFFLLC